MQQVVPFAWTCPYCGRATTITCENYSVGRHDFDQNNKDGSLAIATMVITCPHPKCRQYQITGSLLKTAAEHYADGIKFQPTGQPLISWAMKPQSTAKLFPDYIPQAIRDDYEEACLICKLSPKASATLSRRCLQGIIRDFWKVNQEKRSIQ